MAPIIASQQSEIILLSILFLADVLFPTNINFSRLSFFPTNKHIFLLTSDASFLSKIPTFSEGLSSINLLEIVNPKTLSPKNSSFS